MLPARTPGTEMRFSSPGKIWPLFRLHASVAGSLRVGKKTRLLVYEEASCLSPPDLALPLTLPLCGSLQVGSRLTIRDVFGLTRARFGEAEQHHLAVLPPPLAGVRLKSFKAFLGMEEQSRRKSSEEERYHMREYLPGDRFRDINWKVSSRLEKLITRIAPASQEKTRIITVELRHYDNGDRETLTALAHLNVLKSWLVSFIAAVRAEHPDYHFRVLTGRGAVLLQSEEDFSRFHVELATLPFMPDPGATALSLPADELFVFSTPYDRMLPAVLRSRVGRLLTLFHTVAAEKRDPQAHPFRVLEPFSPVHLLYPWLFLRGRRPASPELKGLADAEALALEVRLI